VTRIISGEAEPFAAHRHDPVSGDAAPATTLRPQTLSEFVGQEQAKANLRVFIEAPRPGARPWTTSCCSARRAWARRRWPRSSPASWG
jgi:hypothetical protein